MVSVDSFHTQDSSFLSEVSLLTFFSKKVSGGDDGIRTHDPLLAGQVLSQLSYTPKLNAKCRMQNAKSFRFLLYSPFFQSSEWISPLRDCVSIELFSRTVSRKVFSPLQSLTSVFGMGTGGPSAFVTLTILSKSLFTEY